jgi:hypothetical protein
VPLADNSNFGSCSHASPAYGALAGTGLQGGMKRGRSDTRPGVADRLLTSCAIKDGIEVLLGFGAAAASLEQCALLDEQRHMMDVAIDL